MSKYLKLLFLFALVSCSGNKQVFWCGDHECVNKSEKEEYFKKYMIVEIRKKNKTSDIEISKVNEIIQQASLNNKNNPKEIENKKLTWKQKRLKKKQEKRFAKKVLQEERKKIRDKKELQKQLLKKEKVVKKLQKDKKLITKNKKIEKKSLLTKKINEKSSSFNDILKKVSEQSSKKSFPDINDAQ